MIKLTIEKQFGQFVVDDKAIPGSPPVGRGRTINDAMAEWLRNNQQRLNIEFEVAESAQAAERARRKRELAKR